LFLVLPELENERIRRLKGRRNRKRKFIKNDGRPLEVKAIHKVLMCLLYMRHNTSHEVVGRMFGFSADSSENAFVEVLPILKRLFQNQRWEAEKRYSSLEEKWSPSKTVSTANDCSRKPLAMLCANFLLSSTNKILINKMCYLFYFNQTNQGSPPKVML